MKLIVAHEAYMTVEVWSVFTLPHVNKLSSETVLVFVLPFVTVCEWEKAAFMPNLTPISTPSLMPTVSPMVSDSDQEIVATSSKVEPLLIWQMVPDPQQRSSLRSAICISWGPPTGFAEVIVTVESSGPHGGMVNAWWWPWSHPPKAPEGKEEKVTRKMHVHMVVGRL